MMRRRDLGPGLLGMPFLTRTAAPDAPVLRLSKQYGLPWPVATMAFIDFVHGVGRLRHRPAGWTDLFYAEAHERDGS